MGRELTILRAKALMTEKALYNRRTRHWTPRAGTSCQREYHRAELLDPGLARHIRKHTARVAPHRALQTQDRLRDVRASRHLSLARQKRERGGA